MRTEQRSVDLPSKPRRGRPVGTGSGDWKEARVQCPHCKTSYNESYLTQHVHRAHLTEHRLSRAPSEEKENRSHDSIDNADAMSDDVPPQKKKRAIDSSEDAEYTTDEDLAIPQKQDSNQQPRLPLLVTRQSKFLRPWQEHDKENLQPLPKQSGDDENIAVRLRTSDRLRTMR